MAADLQDFLSLQRSWDALGTPEQQELCKHLLADGITNSAVIFEHHRCRRRAVHTEHHNTVERTSMCGQLKPRFLPLCLERANTNPFVRGSLGRAELQAAALCIGLRAVCGESRSLCPAFWRPEIEGCASKKTFLHQKKLF